MPSSIKNIPFITYTISSIFPNTLKLFKTGDLNIKNIDAVISLHENTDALYFASKMAEKLNVKAGTLLQLPPFIEDKERLQNLERISYLYQNLVKKYTNNNKLSNVKKIHNKLIQKNTKEKILKIIKNFDVLIPVSKSIPIEMGEKWMNKMKILNPGVSLDNKDISIIKHIKNAKIKRKNFILYSSGFDLYKGIIDAILSFKLIKKYNKNIKLYITGKSRDPTFEKMIKKLIEDLNLKNDIIFTGFVSREQLFKLKAEAKVVIHPSHMDAFPYNVCESMYLGTPVVGYNIPALRIYYKDLNGIKLVEELDTEALASEVINILEQKDIKVDVPKIPNWEDIMNEEISIIKKLVPNKG